MHDGIGFTDVGEELIAQTFALGGARDQTGDVDEFDDGGLDFGGMSDVGKRREAGVGHRDDADVRLDGAERVVRRFDARFGQGVEKSGFANVGQANDAAFEAHVGSSSAGFGRVFRCCVAFSSSPRAIEGHWARARAMASSICPRSSLRGGFNT